MKPRIGISLRVVEATNYKEKRDALSQDWPLFLDKLGLNPILIPNNIFDLQAFLHDMQIDGLVLSGGDNIGDHPERDKTEKIILEFSIKNNIPLIGICRGMEVINNYFGGTLEKCPNDNHVCRKHNIKIINQQHFTFDLNLIEVNSFHHNIITEYNIGKELEAFAIVEEDHTIEGFFHKHLPLVGVMWHPEREQNLTNQSLFKQIFLKSRK